MDISMVTVTIYFVGIAAFVNAPPQFNVTKKVIFPAARSANYLGTELQPHNTFLYLKAKDIATEDPKMTCEDHLGGTWAPDSFGANLCTVTLNGAKVWTLTSEPLTEDPSFRKIPSFMNFCPSAKNLPDWYISEPDPSFVAARFDIKGGKAYGCNRNDQAFVTQLVTDTNDGALYVEQNARTVRVLLNDQSVIAIENKPTAHNHNEPEKHFGWYYAMNTSRINCPIAVPTKPVSGIARCPAIPGADDDSASMAAASADCSNSNYP